jgi:nucleoside-diphosphate-sugar epimerase
VSSPGSTSTTPPQRPCSHSSTGPAIYNIVDEEPAPVREWLPVLADTLGAKPPRHVPVWLARLIGGETAVMIGTDVRGASNAKAKRELGWTLRYPTWRQGFAAVYASSAGADATRGAAQTVGQLRRRADEAA